MKSYFFTGLVWALLAVVTLVAGQASAQTPAAPESGKPAKSKTKKAANPGATGAAAGKAKFIRGSEESPAQRSARLKRECKGGVDAGACSGYTR